MIKSKFKYITIGVLFLSLLGCEKLIFDQTDEGTGNDPKVFLSVTTRAAKSNSGFRSSINTTDTNFEDHVNSLAMVVFENESSTMVGEPYFNNNLGSGESTFAFTVEMKPGNYDFYFIANLPDLETSIGSISIRSDLENLMNSLNDLDSDLYIGATSSKGFPMARVYMNQEVKAGGTVYQPLPFKPKFNSSEVQDVTTTYNENGAEIEYVELIRVVSKLEINFDDTSIAMIDKVVFHNAFGQYSLTPQPSPIESPKYVGDAVLAPITSSNTYVYYMPEALISNSTMWEATSADNKPINYFSITTHSGDVYNVPIITSENIAFSEDYLAKATGQDADYNIYRNHHYKFTVKIHQDIEILYTINPWNLVERQLYMGYGYNVEIDEEGNIIVSNTIDDCMPHKVYLRAVGDAYFGTPDNKYMSVEYGFELESEVTDDNKHKLKSGYSEGFKIDTQNVSVGDSYLEVYYNKLPDEDGVTADKTFTK